MLQEPESMEECVYFTNRIIKEGKVKCWVLKEKCPKCSQALMAKPKDPKTGKPKIRAKEYTCSSCNYTVPLEAYEDTLTANIRYTCPYCKHEDEIQIPYKRKKIRVLDEETGKPSTIDSLRFQCSKCHQNIDIAKKMKEV